MIDEDEEKRSFTSWKLEVLDAINSDIRTGKRKKDKTEKLLIGPQVKCVAYWIMHHVNQKTRTANPSMDRLAAQCGVSRFTVSDCIDRLAFAGWLLVTREARTGNNIYSFNDEIVLDLIDARKQREDEAREVMSERRFYAHLARQRRSDVEVSPHRDVEVLQHHDVEVSLDYDVEVSPPKHLSLNYLIGTPEDSMLLEQRDLSCGTVFPTNEIDFGPWIMANIPDRSHHREALHLLRGRKMTPEILRRMAA